MGSNEVNPAPGKTATGLGVNRWLAQDTDNIAASLAAVQTNFVARRTRLSQTHAAVVAALAFGRVAA